MRVLITGAAGFIGRNMLLSVPRTWEVAALYRSGKSDFLHFIQAHRLHNVQPIACDLTDDQQVQQATKQIGKHFDSCLALASNTSIPASIQQPLQDLTTNVVGLLHLLQHSTFDHMIYVSSGAVYIGFTGLVGPQSALAPTLPYAISKMSAERYIHAYLHHHHTFRSATVIRFFGAYGPYEPPRKLYTRLVRQFAFERNPEFTVIGDGENYIDAMYVDDAVRALMAVLLQPAADGFRCIDLGVGSRETVNQVVIRAARTFDLEARLHHEGCSPEYIQFVIDPQPFTSMYQFTPTIPLEEGLRHLAHHILQSASIEKEILT